MTTVTHDELPFSTSRVPTPRSSLVDRAAELLAAGKLVDAADSLERHLITQPSDARALRILAMSRLRQGRAQQAYDHAHESAELQPGIGLTHYIMSVALTSLGEHAEAITEARTAIDLEPDTWYFHAQLASVLTVARDKALLTEAIAAAHRAARLSPDSAAKADVFAMAYEPVRETPAPAPAPAPVVEMSPAVAVEPAVVTGAPVAAAGGHLPRLTRGQTVWLVLIVLTAGLTPLVRAVMRAVRSGRARTRAVALERVAALSPLPPRD